MIKPAEIQKKARTEGVRDQQIEKDYILSWILYGISKHEKLSESIIFKGGTVLKRVYFDDYRYSEDLDFTLIDYTLSNNDILTYFGECFEQIKDSANIPLQIVNVNEHKDTGINFYISYTGPLGGVGANKKIKIDISRAEKLEFDCLLKDAIISYSDIVPH